MTSPSTATPMPLLAMSLAVTLPPLVAYSLSPSVTMLNHLLSVGGWGWVLLSLMVPAARRDSAWRVTWPVVAALLLLAGAATWSWHDGLPRSLALTALGLIGAGLFTLLGSATNTLRAASTDDPFHTFASAMLVAGVFSALIALLQVFAPAWTDGHWIARSGIPGRAVGNLRQPNHLSSLLLWALIALVPLAQQRRWWGEPLSRRLAVALGALLVLGVVLTASRTGVVGVVMLALWAAADRRLDRGVRGGLLAAPLVYLLCWLLLAWWAHSTQHTFGGEARLAEADLSASRFGIWANTWALLQQQPWTGVGLGQFNFAWTLTPFPGRPVAFFDHSHNIVLQLLVELGWPLGSLVLGLLVVGLVLAGQRTWRAEGPQAVGARSAFMMVLLISVHSLLEYPLWYAYFLLPMCWALGHALAVMEPGQEQKPMHDQGTQQARPMPSLQIAGAVLLVASVWAFVDYLRVVDIYAPIKAETPLNDRIARGQQSLLYRYQADYAAVTTLDAAVLTPEAFDHTTHALLDTRLMMAWAQTLSARGQEDKARYLAARLREFRNPAAKAFFAPCDDEAVADKPFQCLPPERPTTWRDFLPSR